MSSRSKIGKAAREKGKRGEREVAGLLRKLGYDSRRGVQYSGSPDSPDVVGLDDIHLEVKRVESFRLYPSLEQSIGDAGAEEFPVVVHRKNNEQWVVVQPLEDWMMFYAAAEELHRQSSQKAERSLRGFLEGLFGKLR